MPEHYEGRPMGAATGTDKPLILPGVMVEVLRGERGYAENDKAVAELGISYYQEGKSGKPYRLDPPPLGAFPPHVVEWVDRFLLACWEQGRRDAGEELS